MAIAFAFDLQKPFNLSSNLSLFLFSPSFFFFFFFFFAFPLPKFQNERDSGQAVVWSAARVWRQSTPAVTLWLLEPQRERDLGHWRRDWLALDEHKHAQRRNVRSHNRCVLPVCSPAPFLQSGKWRVEWCQARMKRCCGCI